MNPSAIWKLTDTQATANWSVEQTDVSLNVPTDSLDQGGTMTLGDAAVSLFAMEQPEGQGQSQEDIYVRGHDLIMMFSGDNDPFDREIYWRMRGVDDEAADEEAADDSLQSLEVIFSLKTDLLETWPDPLFNVTVAMESAKHFVASGDLTDATRAWVESPENAVGQLMLLTLKNGCRLAVGVFPSDHEALRLEPAGEQTKIQFDLQTDFLEKGVIRRTRLFACPGSSGTSDAALLEQANQFLNSEIPLTT